MAFTKNNTMSIGNLLISILLFVVFLIIATVGFLTLYSWNDRKVDYEISTEGLLIPEFTHQTIPFEPAYDEKKTLPFAASAVIDIDGDGIEELFFGGGRDQQDAFYRFDNGKFVDVSANTGWEKDAADKTFSAVSLDLDEDGDNDLVITRQSGVWLYENKGAQFSGKNLNLDLDSETVPLSVGLADLNRDGHFDMFVAGYIAREFVQGETIFNLEYGGVSELFINNGDNTFSNVTNAAGMNYKHNTFLGMFIDVDNDLNADLMVAHDTGQIRIWKNNGDLTFTDMPNPSSDVFSYPMGIAVTDLGNDGLPDFYFSNVGSTTPDSMVRGDLREDQILYKKWFLFSNKGDFLFNDIAQDAGIADYEFSWGAVFEDFNLDGRDDLVVSENYAGWPLHKVRAWRLEGRFLLQNPQGKFAEVSNKVGISNKEYGITPLTADFNQDGYPDLVHVNLLGPQQVYLSKAGGQNYLKVKLPNVVRSIGARVSVELENGEVLNQYFVVGEGLVSDQSHVLVFGLNNLLANKVSVQFLDGDKVSETGEFLNATVEFE